MKKLVISFFSILIIFLLSCGKKSVSDLMEFEKIFNSLPKPNVIESDMTVELRQPGNGPDYYVLSYKGKEIFSSSKVSIKIIAKDVAFIVESYGTVSFVNNNTIDRFDAIDILQLETGTTEIADLRNYEIKVDSHQEFAYIRAEWWSEKEIKRNWSGKNFNGEKIYWRYSLITGELMNAAGRKI